MKHTAFMVGVCLLLGMMAGVVAGVQPVACARDESFLNTPLTGTLPALAKVAPSKESGLVHPQASVATLVHGATKLKVALDSDSATAKRLNLLRVDFTGAGKFSKEYTVRLLYQNIDMATIRPATFQVTREGMTLPVQVTGELYLQEEGVFQIALWLTSALQDSCAIGGKTYTARVIDADSNLHFGDRIPPLNGKLETLFNSIGDTLYLDIGDGAFTKEDTIVKSFYGHPVFINDAWYVITLSDDRKALTAAPFQGALGQMKMHMAGWSGMLLGGKYLLNVTGLPRETPFPADRYALLMYSETMPASGSAKQPSKVEYSYTDEQHLKMVEVKAGALTEPKLGVPLQAVITAQQGGSTLTFSFELRDSGGTGVAVNITDRGAIASPVTFEVRNAKGVVVHTGTFEHG